MARRVSFQLMNNITAMQNKSLELDSSALKKALQLNHAILG